MSAIDDIRDELEREGALLVRGDHYAGGHLIQVGTDLVVSDLFLSERGVAYVTPFADHAHAFRVRSWGRNGSDEWELVVDDRLRLVVSSVWLQAQRRLVADWAKAPERPSARADAEDLLASL